MIPVPAMELDTFMIDGTDKEPGVVFQPGEDRVVSFEKSAV